MKKFYSVLTVVILAVVMLFSQVIVFASSEDRAREDGKKMGEVAGMLAGAKDFSEDQFDYNMSIKSGPRLIEDHNLELLYSKEDIEVFIESYTAAYKTAYEKAWFEAFDKATGTDHTGDEVASTTNPQATAGMADGANAGKIDGALDGADDYINGYKNSYVHKMMKGSEIRAKYKLDIDTYSYSHNFVEAYKKAYKAAYNESYRKAKVSDVVEKEGAALGENIGKAYGAVESMNDYAAERKLNYEVAYARFLKAGALAERFHFDKHSAYYAENFEKGFAQGFKQAYIAAYRARFTNFEIDNSSTYEVGVNSQEITKMWPLYDVAGGTVSEKPGLACTLSIPQGTVYQPMRVQLSGEQFTFGSKNYRYLPVSSIFNIDVWSSAEEVKLRKPIEIKFDFTGSERVGIYKWSDYRWKYQPTKITDESISTIIPAGVYDGGRYAIFVDEHCKFYRDIDFCWARDEINAFMRRMYFFRSDYFRPDDYMTRAELSIILSNMLYDKFPIGDSHKEALDRDAFGKATSSIDFVISNGFMSLNAGKFYPNSPVRYKYLKYIYKAITGENIEWNEVAEKIMRDKFYKSPGIDNPSLGMTRAEVIYFLYHYLDTDDVLENIER